MIWEAIKLKYIACSNSECDKKIYKGEECYRESYYGGITCSDACMKKWMEEHFSPSKHTYDPNEDGYTPSCANCHFFTTSPIQYPCGKCMKTDEVVGIFDTCKSHKEAGKYVTNDTVAIHTGYNIVEVLQMAMGNKDK